MQAYRKLIAAGVGILALLLQRHYNVDIAGLEPTLVDAIIGALTALAVWWFPNTKAPTMIGLNCNPYAVAFLALLVVLAGCAGTPQVRAVNGLATACESHAVALEQLTPLRAAGKLSPGIVTTVDRINTVVVGTDAAPGPCHTASTIDPAAGATIVQGAVAILRGVMP